MPGRTAWLTGRVCAVTGGAQGLGWALTEALARQGATVHACDLSERHLATAQDALNQRPWGDRVHLTHQDVTARADIQHWIVGTGGPDILVNNAMFTRWVDVERMSVAEAELTMRTAFDAMVYTVTAALPRMRARGRGHIVNIGSSAGHAFVRGPSAAYAAGKAAVEAYSRMLAIELTGTPINVTLVRPGVITGTEFHGRHVPIGRMPRLADLMPSVTAGQTAEAVLRGIRRRKHTVDVPGWVGVAIRTYDLLPRLVTRLSMAGGASVRDYGGPHGAR